MLVLVGLIPRKKKPKWERGQQFTSALLKQAYMPPDLDKVFFVMETSPDLVEIFPANIKRRFNHRGSSAVWNKAPKTHKY